MKANWLKRIAGKLYLFAKFEGEKLLAEASSKSHMLLAKIGRNTIISKEATITNGSGIPEKIIIGDNCWIRCQLLVYNTKGRIKIGDYCIFGADTRIWSAGSISIGNRVGISHNVNIHDNNSHPILPGERHEHFKHIMNNDPLLERIDFGEEEIVIEDDVWIGFNVTIMKGVTIGKGALIGAHSIITKDVPPYSVVVGKVPNMIIKYIKQP